VSFTSDGHGDDGHQDGVDHGDPSGDEASRGLPAGVVARRGAGGLVSGLAPLFAGSDATWVAAAMSDADRSVAARGVVTAEDLRVQLVAIDAARYRMAYDVIGNATLWFLHHGLWDLSRRPRFDQRWREAWDAYRAYNAAFADVVVDTAPDGAAVLVQDYHLTLLAPSVRERRPDLRVVHFHHTPFSSADLLRVLPDAPRRELLIGLASHHACGFHTQRWASNFLWCCHDQEVEPPATFVSPLSSDPDDIRGAAASAACAEELRWIDQRVGDRQLIVRVDRIELSKNLVRRFLAFDELLERWPEWRERVVFGAFVYPSREGLAEYLAYRQEVEGLVRRINERWSTDNWQPILYDASDNFPRSVAALRRYDVLLVNPIRDGLNLVAKEGALVNERDGVLVLSTEAGAWSELGGVAVGINPFDVSSGAEALASALAMAADERRALAAAVRALAEARTPRDWLGEQLAAAG
jgi:trehalose 6-phosphate synthase